jgi:hypothetical protein
VIGYHPVGSERGIVRRLRNILLVVLPIALATCISSASAATNVISGCDNPLDSALNQYCDAVPTAVGKQPPRAGTPALSSTLPPQAVAAIGTASSSQKLLELPAPVRHVGHRTPATKHGATVPSDVSGQATAGSSLPLWLILLMAALALALASAAYARWQRQRPA